SPAPAMHAVSLVDPTSHYPALMQLVNTKISDPVIAYIVDCVSETVDYGLERADSASSPQTSRGHSRTRPSSHQRFYTFVCTVLSDARVSFPTVLVALAYIARGCPRLRIGIEKYASERVFLGALIIASKYTQDSTLRNVHWAQCTRLFSTRDVCRIEYDFLTVLGWKLAVREEDLLAHREGFLAAALNSSPRTHIRPPMEGLVATRPHTHHRRASSGSVPDLEPSSPQSSEGSVSPPTP
ncbi:hypothetical protein DFH07DRAFT_700247, partial [Mycena maculata]